MDLPVNEVFSTIQGEGSLTGTPAIFVRLQFCAVGCPWCDTKHTWDKFTDDQITWCEMLAKEKDSPKWANVTSIFLHDWLRHQPEKLIVITGGEPCNYDLRNLTTLLHDSGKQVQIETSGTEYIKANDHTFITLSPKMNMPGGKEVLGESYYLADEIKMPIGKMEDVETLKEILRKNIFSVPVFVQPLSQSPKATKLCIEAARMNGWRLSAQLHKYIGVR